MALVKITPNNEKVTPKAGAAVEVVFDVSNPSEAPLKIGVDTVGELKEKSWTKVQGAVEVTLPPLGQEKLKVTVTIPATAERKDYTFKLRVYDPRDPERADESKAIVVSLPPQIVPPPPPGKTGGPRWGLIIAAIVGGLVVVGGGVTAVILLGGSPKVPNLVAKDTLLTDAKKILEDKKFKLGPVTEQASAKPALTVLSQTPAPDTKADKGTTVALTVSAVSEAVPQVLSLNVPSAKEKLIGAGFKLGKVTVKTTKQSPGGTVTAQEPAPGERAIPGSPVDLVVEQQAIAVPRLATLTVEKATQSLKDLGLTVGATSNANTGAPALTIVGQKPEPGVEVEPGTAVELLVEGRKTAVPNVTNKPIGEATRILVANGLQVAAVGYDRSSAANPVDIVKSQSPGPDAQVAPGTEMSLVVYGKPLIFLPGVFLKLDRPMSKMMITPAGPRMVTPE